MLLWEGQLLLLRRLGDWESAYLLRAVAKLLLRKAWIVGLSERTGFSDDGAAIVTRAECSRYSRVCGSFILGMH